MFAQAKIISKLDCICKYSLLLAIFVLPFSKALMDIFITATILSWFLYRLSIGNFYGDKKYLFVIFGLFIIVSSLSSINSGYPSEALRGTIRLFKFVLVAFILSELATDPKWLKKLLYVAFLSYALVILDSLTQLFAGQDFIRGFSYQHGNSQVRLMGPFISYGLLAAFLIAMTPIVAVFMLNNRSWIWKIVFAIFTLASIFLLYKTQSRGAWIASIVAWSAFSFFTRNRSIQIALIAILVVAPLVLPYNALIHLDEFGKEQSLVERYYLWDRAVQVIRAKPLFGCGNNTFIKNYQKYDRTKNQRVPEYPAHNGFLQIAAGSGLIALGLFLVIIAMALKSGWRAFSNYTGEMKLLAAGLLTGFIALLCQGFIATTFHNPQSGLLLWLFVGLLISIEKWSTS